MPASDVCSKCGTNLGELRDGERKTVRDLRAEKAALNSEIRRLASRLSAADTTSGVSEHPYLQSLLDRLAATFVALEDAADPRRSSPIEAQMRYRRPSSSADEGASTRWARSLIAEGRRDIGRWVSKVDAVLSGHYTPPPPPPKARCGHTGCRLFDKVQKGRPGEPFRFCVACGRPFSEGRIQNQYDDREEAS